MIRSRKNRFLSVVYGLTMLLSAWLLGPAARANELLQRDGKFIHLTTDLADPAQANDLVASFDAAVPQWAKFWGMPDDALADWKIDACVIGNKAEFERRRLIPDEVPDFPFGYALGNQVFVLAQPSGYYTRHLLLHEGVHSLAYFHYGGAGTTWFQEGTAELLATHSGSGDDLTINQIPIDRQSVPLWGRFKMIDQQRQQGQIPTLDQVWQYQPSLRDNVESYSFSWAAVMLLDMYPQYRPTLLQAASFGRRKGPGFNRRLIGMLNADMPVIAARWRVLTHQLDYGFDRSREQVSLSVDDPVWHGDPVRVQVAADRGWQSVGLRVPGNVRLRIAARGSVTLADQPKPWTSEPQGITYRYERGRPLGQLLVCLLPNAFDPAADTLPPLEVHAVGRDITLDVESFSWVLLRVNDAAGELADNRGQYEVQISRP